MKKLIKTNMPLIALIIAFACCLTSHPVWSANSLEITGFARAVGGYLDTERASFKGYENAFSMSEKSLAAVQADYQFSDALSGSAQLLLHTSEERNSGVEWLYLTYSPHVDVVFNAGRLRTPFLKYSDVIDVGYAYPWISAPQQLYGSYLFSQYEGVNVRYRQSINGFALGYEAYYGQYNDDNNSTESDVSVNGLLGSVINVDYEGFQVRLASVNGSRVYADIAEIAPLIGSLTSANFNSTADQLKINGSANAYLFGLSYDSFKWYANTEWMRLTSNINVLGTISSFYISAGYYVDELLIHITYASSRQSLPEFENNVPLNVNPQLNQLHNAVQQVSRAFPTNDLDSLTLGARWDFMSNLALKAEMTLLKGKPNKTSFFDLAYNGNDFERKAVLSQIALEWVF